MVDTSVKVSKDVRCVAFFSLRDYQFTLLSNPEGILDIASDERVIPVTPGSEIRVSEDGYTLHVTFGESEYTIGADPIEGSSYRSESGRFRER